MTKDTPFKLLLYTPIALFVTGALLYLFGYQRIRKWQEYRKDQTYLKKAMSQVPEEPKSSVIYDQIQGYYCPGCCMVGAAAGLARHMEGTDFDTFVAYSIPTTFYTKHQGENDRYGPGLDIWRGFKNLGYTAYRGAPTPVHPPEVIFPEYEPENFITFKDRVEEIEYMKRLLSVGVVPIVNLGDFLLMVGYEGDNRFTFSTQTREGSTINSPHLMPNQEREFAEWTNVWGGQNLSYPWETGSTVYWVEKTHEAKTAEEIMALNKAEALKAPEKVKETIAYLKRVNHFRDYTTELDSMAMAALSRWLKTQDRPELAEIYWQIAMINDEAGQTSERPNVEEVITVLEETLPLYEQAAAQW